MVITYDISFLYKILYNLNGDNMKKFLSTLFWILVIALMCLWTYEFYRVRNGYKPQFCIKENLHVYADGDTEECIGLGYKVYTYDRYNLAGTEFVSIFAKERQLDFDNEDEPEVEPTETEQESESEEPTE